MLQMTFAHAQGYNVYVAGAAREVLETIPIR